MSRPLNYYGLPITPPEHFDGEHVAAVPTAGGLPPVCSCGWTRWQDEHGRWFEMSDHLADMGESGYVIVSDFEDDEDGYLYWSNEDGWGFRSTATVFTEAERNDGNLPMGAGGWERA